MSRARPTGILIDKQLNALSLSPSLSIYLTKNIKIKDNLIFNYSPQLLRVVKNILNTGCYNV